MCDNENGNDNNGNDAEVLNTRICFDYYKDGHVAFDELLNEHLCYAAEHRQKIHEDYPFKNQDLTFSEELLVFLLSRISHRHMNYLLNIFKWHNVNAPSSVYMLLKLSKIKDFVSNISCSTVSRGQFAYLSILDIIKFCIEKGYLNLSGMYNDFDISIGIDGVPLFKSSNFNLWPILLRLKNCSYYKPLPIAVFAGIGKPDLAAFLEKVHQELILLKEYCRVCDFFVKLKSIVFICTSGVEIDAAAEEPGIFEFGKDGTIWLKLADEDKRVRRQSQNVIKHVPGPIREAKARIITPFDALKCLMDVTLISWIVSYIELEATR